MLSKPFYNNSDISIVVFPWFKVDKYIIKICCNGTKCVAEVRVIAWVTVSIKSDILKGI